MEVEVEDGDRGEDEPSGEAPTGVLRGVGVVAATGARRGSLQRKWPRLPLPATAPQTLKVVAPKGGRN